MEAPQTSNADAVQQQTSLGSRLMNIYIAPSEVFDEIKNSPPQASNWLVPLVAATIVAWIYVMVVFSQPAVLQGMKDAQAQKWQQMVNSGKYTQQQADQIQAMSEKFMTPTFLRVVMLLSFTFAQPVMLFFMALVIWLLGAKLFHGGFGYMKAVEGVGIAGMISIPVTIVTMLLAVIYGNAAMTPGPVLLVSHFDQFNHFHKVLSSTFNLGGLWYVAVLAIGLSRLSGASFLKSALWGFGLWILLTAGPALAFGGK